MSITVNTLTLLVLALHLLADYHLQWASLSDGKRARLAPLFVHGFIYMACMALPLLLDRRLWPGLLVIAGSHLALDFFKSLLLNKGDQKGEAALFFIDQALHIAVILLCCEVFFRPAADSGIHPLNVDALKWALLLLFVTKPANITMKQALKKYAGFSVPKDLPEQATVPGAGAMIGNLERVLTAILLGLSQFAAIGLVFTAKSIARFDRISKDQGFAEYYLIGSLFSLLWVFIGWIVLFKLL